MLEHPLNKNAEANKRSREKNHTKHYQDQKDRRNQLKGRLQMLYQSAVKRAKLKDIDFSITCDDLLELWIRQDGKCAVTNMEMSLKAGTREFINDFAVSVDQIIPKGGYTKSNLQLVCRAVNQIKWNRSEESFFFWVEKIYYSLLEGQSAAKL